MKKQAQIFIALTMLLISVLSACNSPALSPTTQPVDANAIGTQVAATIEAEIRTTIQAENQPSAEQPSATQEATPTETLTATPEPSFTPTLGAPRIQVSVDTNCRTGPGKVYDFAGALVVGQEADVVGVPEDNRDYVIIQNPDAPGKCWLWTEYATITGDLSNLEEYAIPFTPTPVPGSISGVVWNDKCSQFDAGDPPPGCVAPANAGDPYPANGKIDSGESGFSGIQVRLGTGNCPSVGLATTTTKSDGTYSFGNLAPGKYCISIDPLNAQNSAILIPGGWSYPSLSGQQDVTVDSGADVTGISFGWDFQLD